MNPGPLYLALIYLHPGQQEALRRYEEPGPSRFPPARRTVRANPEPGSGSRRRGRPGRPRRDRFETPDGLDAVRRDPEMVALVSLREAVVRKALLVRVDEVPLERYFTARS